MHSAVLQRLTRLGLACALAAATIACTSSDVSVSAPSAVKCQVTADPSLKTVPPDGGTGVYYGHYGHDFPLGRAR